MPFGQIFETGPRSSNFRASENGLVREYTRIFTVKMDLPALSGNEVLETVGLPQELYPYLTNTTNDLGSLVRSRIPTQMDQAGVFWKVVVNYSSEGPRLDRQEPDPRLRPPQIEWTFEKYKAPLDSWLYHDGSNWVETKVVNSAGDPFDPPFERERLRLVLDYRRIVSVHDKEKQFAIVSKPLNKTAWYGFQPRKAKVEDLRYSEYEENGTLYWRENWLIKMDEQGWDISALDAGYYEVVGGVRRLITDEYGRPFQNPSLLNGSGAKLAVGAPPVFLSRRYLEETEFNDFNIP